MEYVIRKFARNFSDTQSAFKIAFNSLFGGFKSIESKEITTTFQKKSFRGVCNCSVSVKFVNVSPDDETAFFIIIEKDDYSADVSSDINRIIDEVEHILCSSSSYCSLSPADFSGDEKSVTEEKVFLAKKLGLISKEEFKEIVEKLIAAKNLFDAGIFNKEEYEEMANPLIDRL